MGRYKVNNDGTLGAMISGRGKAEYGASTVRTGSLSVTGIPKVGSSPAYKEITVTFDSPMPDANYELETSVGYQAFVFTAISNKTANGFRAVFTSIYTNSDIDITFTYTAYKLYTDTEYNNILAAMPSNASASNKLVAESEIPKTKIYTYTDAVTAGDNIILDPSSSHDWWNLFSSGNILSISIVSCDTANAMDVGAWVGTTTTNHSLILKPAITSSGSYYQVLVTYTGVSL